MNRVTVGIAQFFFMIGLLILYFNVPSYIDSSFISASIVFVILSLFTRSLQFERNRLLLRNPFTVTNFFLLAYCITLFQIPLEYLLSTFNDESRFHRYFYDYSIINKSILFSALCLVSFNFGQIFVQEKNNSILSKESSATSLINIKPFLIVTNLLFILHVVTVDRGYYFGGDVALTGLSLTIHGYLMRFITIFVFISIWNSKSISNKTLDVFSFFKIFPKSFLFVIFALCLLTLFAGDRGPIIRIILTIAFGYFILSHRKISFITFLFLIAFSGFLLSIAKLAGGYSEGVGYIESFSAAQQRFNDSDRVESISPYTLELAGSIYANTILFSLWDSGMSLYGMGLFTGVLMAFPAGVTFFSELTGLSGEAINSAYLATVVVGKDYGVGTTVVGDALINLGFLGAIISFIILGALMRKVDVTIYQNKLNFKWGLLAFVLISNIVILPRYSMFGLIGVYLFDYAVIFLIVFLTKKKIKRFF